MSGMHWSAGAFVPGKGWPAVFVLLKGAHGTKAFQKILYSPLRICLQGRVTLSNRQPCRLAAAVWAPACSGFHLSVVGESKRASERERWMKREGLPPLRSSCGLPGCPTFIHILYFSSARGLTFTDRLLHELTSLALLKLKVKPYFVIKICHSLYFVSLRRFLKDGTKGDGTSL